MTIYISRTDLARNTRKTIERARREGLVMIESYGEEQVAILDAIDYRLMRAAAGYQSRPGAPAHGPAALPAGLSDEEIQRLAADTEGDPQAVWNRVMFAYLDEDISLGRAATLLNLSRFELQARFNRLGIPIRIGPETIEEARSEYEVLMQTVGR